MRPCLVLILAVLAVLAVPPVAADPTPPDWLAARADSLLAARPADPDRLAAWPDTLLALAHQLADLGHPHVAALAMEQAGIQAFRLSDLERAVAIWNDGLAYVREHGDREREAGLLNALAVGYTVSERIDEAIATYGRSLALKTALGDTVGVSRTWSNLASAYQQVGRVAEAMAATTEARRWNVLAGNRPGEAAVAVNEAGILNDLGRHHEALRIADQALARLDATADLRDTEALAQLRRTEALLGLRREAEALAAVERALAACEAEGADYYGLFARQWRVEVLRRLGRPAEARAALDDFARALAAGDVDRLRTVRLLYDGLLHLDAGRPDSAQAVLGRAVADFERRWRSHRDDATRAGLFGISGDVYGALAHARLALGDTVGAWRVTERGQAALFRERAAPGEHVADLAAVQATLAAADAVLLQACETQAEPLVWFVVTPTSLSAVTAVDPGPLAADARAALALLAGGAEASRCDPVLGRMGRALLAPLAYWLGGGDTRAYVVTPSTLAGFPLAVLPLADGHRLGDAATLAHVPSATALVLLTDTPARRGGMLAMGDPAIAPDPGRDRLLPADPLREAAATPLPEAGREIRRVAAPGAAVRLGPEASLATFLDEARSAAVVHLATHAVSDPLDGRRSAIILADSVPGGGPTVLTAAAAETLGMAPDLAVLSACRSGLGRAVLGEGGFGLPRSFLLAGARSVVSSLWDVEDAAARRFMEAFYAGLRRGLARDTALRDAASALAAAGAPPRDWAAFVLTGVGHEPVPALTTSGTSTARRLAPWGLALLVLGIGVARLVGHRRRRCPSHSATD